MDNTRKRVAFYISREDEQKLDAIKREQFYNKSYAEMYRILLNFAADYKLAEGMVD